MISVLKLHQQLPPGVHPYPTLRGKQRFDLLQTFNLVLACYIVLHQLVVPLAVFLLQTEATTTYLTLNYWYLFHWAVAGLMWKRVRRPSHALWVVYLAWFALGYLPLTFAETLIEEGKFRFGWKALSGVLCYGSSLVWTLFLLYRMRMPTTAFLFGLEQRILPKWRYAVPYFSLGLALSLFWIFCPLGKQLAEGGEKPASPVNEIVKQRYQYD